MPLSVATIAHVIETEGCGTPVATIIVTFREDDQVVAVPLSLN